MLLLTLNERDLESAMPPRERNSEATINTILLIFSVLFWVGTLIAVPLILVWLPTDYLLVQSNKGFVRRTGGLWRYPYWIFKNLIGVIFVIAGIIMLVLPGQGILTIVLGLALINFPGKRRVIRRLFGNRHIFNGINRLRARASKPPLEAPPDESHDPA